MSEHISHLEPTTVPPGQPAYTPLDYGHHTRWCPKCWTKFSVNYHGRCFHCDLIVQPHMPPASWWLEGGKKCRCGYPEDQPVQVTVVPSEPKRIGREFL